MRPKTVTDPGNTNLSFAGCGHLGIYHVGVATCFRINAPYVFNRMAAGASVGALVASAMLCDVPLDVCTRGLIKAALEAGRKTLGPFHPGFNIMEIIRTGMDEVLPEDAHIRCNGRLFVSVTRSSDGRNVLLSQFESKQDLLQALICSCFIPFYCGTDKPKFHDVVYTDGGLSDNQPVIDDHTVTVAPFFGESDICPQDPSCNWMQISLGNTSIAVTPGNLYRIIRILFPGGAEMLSQLCRQGFDDAFRFLRKNNFPTSSRYLAVQTRLSFGHPAPEIGDLKKKKKDEIRSEFRFADVHMPEEVQKVIREEILVHTKSGFLARILQYKLGKIFVLPYLVSFDLLRYYIAKICRHYPAVRNQILKSFQNLMLLLTQVAEKLKPHRHYYKLSCSWAVKEFDFTPSRVNSTPVMDSPIGTDSRERLVGNVKVHFTSDQPLTEPVVDAEMSSTVGSITNRAIQAATTALDLENANHGRERAELQDILQLTEKNEALMSFCYLDENKRLNCTSIYDVNDDDRIGPS